MSEIELRDHILRLALQLQRMTAGDQAKADRLMRELIADLKQLLQSNALSEAGKAEINALIKDAEKSITATYAQIAKVTDTHALALIVADKTVEALEDVLPLAIGKPTPEVLASLTKDVLIDGAPSSAWWEKQAEDTAFKFAAQVRQGVINGETNEQIVARVAGNRAGPGIMDVARRNARALVHSSVMSAANDARLATYRKNAKLIAGVRWLSTLDSHTCVTCAALDGASWDLDGQKLKGTKIDFRAPPAHWSCFPGNTPVTSRGRVTGASKRWFDGEVVVIRTASNLELTCTPNHPILTDRGWVAAGLLDVGSNVVRDLRSEWPSATDGDRNDVPAPIEQIAEAFLASELVSAVPMEVTAKDFHGDGEGSDVAVVGTNRLLAGEVDSPLDEHGGQALLVRGGLAGLVPLASGGHTADFLERLPASARCCVNGREPISALLEVESGPLKGFGFGLIAPLDPMISEDAGNYEPVETELLSNGILGHAADVGATDGLLINDSPRPDWYVSMLQFAHDHGVRDPSLAADLGSIQAADVELDAVVECRRVRFANHVYNLETETGLYLANGLVVHNCRCVLSPIPKSFRDLGIDIPEPDEAGERASSEGPVAATTTFADFLDRQSPAFVAKVLGAKRAAMFRDGKLTLSDLVSGTGRELTLDELEHA